MKTEWQSEWPTEPGFWWFYGKRFENDVDSLYFVKVVRTSQPGVYSYITDGIFLYKEEGAHGRWTIVQLPKMWD